MGMKRVVKRFTRMSYDVKSITLSRHKKVQRLQSQMEHSKFRESSFV